MIGLSLDGFIDKMKNQVWLIDIAIPGDSISKQPETCDENLNRELESSNLNQDL